MKNRFVVTFIVLCIFEVLIASVAHAGAFEQRCDKKAGFVNGDTCTYQKYQVSAQDCKNFGGEFSGHNEAGYFGTCNISFNRSSVIDGSVPASTKVPRYIVDIVKQKYSTCNGPKQCLSHTRDYGRYLRFCQNKQETVDACKAEYYQFAKANYAKLNTLANEYFSKQPQFAKPTIVTQAKPYLDHCHEVRDTVFACAAKDVKDARALLQKSKPATKTNVTKKPPERTKANDDRDNAEKTDRNIKLSRASNVRSSRMFYGQDNVIDQLAAGTDVRVLSQKTLPSGAYALEVEITAPSDKTSLNNKKPLYVWMSKNEMHQANRSPSGTEADANCSDCKPENKKTSIDDIKDITSAVEQQDSETTKEKVTPAATASPSPSPTASPTTEIFDASGIDKTSSSKPTKRKFSEMTKAEKDAVIKRYANSPQVQKTTDWSKDKVKRSKGIGKCYRWVKEALATKTKAGKGPGNNLVPNPWFGGIGGKDGANDLSKMGWVNLLADKDFKDIMKDQNNMPRGAVLIYKKKKILKKLDRYGHAEIKLEHGSKGGYASDYISAQSRAGKSNYELTGVMIRPDL